MEYQFKKNNMDKDTYLTNFHTLSSTRASLGQGDILKFDTPPNPVDGHRAIRIETGFGSREGEAVGFLGVRPAYHDIDDMLYGYMRGTQIEFFNLELSYTDEDDLEIENATIFSVISLAQRSEFFKNLSWRLKLGYDRDTINDTKAKFLATAGGGFSWGNEYAYIYFLADPFAYLDKKTRFGIGSSVGIVFDNVDWMNTHAEFTYRLYDEKETQKLANITQSFRLHQNTELKLNYDYQTKTYNDITNSEETFRLIMNFYF